jgi:hypothetical protein
MIDNQRGGVAPVVAHSQAEKWTLRLVMEFNERECREYAERRDSILKMLDEAEALLEAGRQPVRAGD